MEPAAAHIADPGLVAQFADRRAFLCLFQHKRDLAR
jgi:hypothetical protein